MEPGSTAALHRPRVNVQSLRQVVCLRARNRVAVSVLHRSRVHLYNLTHFFASSFDFVREIFVQKGEIE
jgi:hypothetical protein